LKIILKTGDVLSTSNIRFKVSDCESYCVFTCLDENSSLYLKETSINIIHIENIVNGREKAGSRKCEQCEGYKSIDKTGADYVKFCLTCCNDCHNKFIRKM